MADGIREQIQRVYELSSRGMRREAVEQLFELIGLLGEGVGALEELMRALEVEGEDDDA